MTSASGQVQRAVRVWMQLDRGSDTDDGDDIHLDGRWGEYDEGAPGKDETFRYSSREVGSGSKEQYEDGVFQLPKKDVSHSDSLFLRLSTDISQQNNKASAQAFGQIARTGGSTTRGRTRKVPYRYHTQGSFESLKFMCTSNCQPSRPGHSFAVCLWSSHKPVDVLSSGRGRECACKVLMSLAERILMYKHGGTCHMTSCCHEFQGMMSTPYQRLCSEA